MSDIPDLSTLLPPSWEIKYSCRKNQPYTSDAHSKITTWEDSSPKCRPGFYQGSSSNSVRQEETTLFQPGYLDYHGCNSVYPLHSYPMQPQHAYHPKPLGQLMHNTALNQNVTSNARYATPFNKGLGTVMGASAFQQRSQQNMEALISANTDELVAKISAIFPTVSETHIRCLLKKYHNREAVVMSALQVEKHPIATPGPFANLALTKTLPKSTPSHTSYQMTPPLSSRGTPSMSTRSIAATPPVTIRGSIGTPPTRGSSPFFQMGSGNSYYSSSVFGDYRQSPKSQKSPKMKLRYLKNIFPKVEETTLLDVLISENSNVTKTAERLKAMGFEKKDMKNKAIEKIKKDDSSQDSAVKKTEKTKPVPPPRIKSLEEKNKSKIRLAALFEDVPERIIQIALESVDFDEEKARHLLTVTICDKKDDEPHGENILTHFTTPKTKQNFNDKELVKGKYEKKNEGGERKSKSKRDVPKISRGTCTTEDKEFKSVYATKSVGRNAELRKGPNEQLLLADYMTWNGPNPDLRSGRNKSLVEGSNKDLLQEMRTVAKGPDKENWRGPHLGLAKGSIYSQISRILKIES